MPALGNPNLPHRQVCSGAAVLRGKKRQTRKPETLSAPIGALKLKHRARDDAAKAFNTSPRKYPAPNQNGADGSAPFR